MFPTGRATTLQIAGNWQPIVSLGHHASPVPPMSAYVSNLSVPLLLATQTNPKIRARPHIALEKTFERNQITVMNCSLHEAEAYRAMFAFALPLRALDDAQACNIPKAIKNAEVFAAEVMHLVDCAATEPAAPTR